MEEQILLKIKTFLILYWSKIASLKKFQVCLCHITTLCSERDHNKGGG